MSRNTPPPDRFSENSRLNRVQVFAAGRHRDKEYTIADLDDMVRNFNQSSVGDRAALRVPGVLGHEEQQDLLKRSDIPAAAWGERLYREGRYLYADFGDVPQKVANLISSKRYRKVSAEVYDEPPRGIKGRGKMLRRVAFLGGDIPQIKGLDDIPMPESHSERFAPGASGVRLSGPLKVVSIRQRPEGLWQVFSEVSPVNRMQMLEFLGQHGIDTSALTDAVPDQVLADFVRALEAKEHEPMDQEKPQMDQPMPGSDTAPDPAVAASQPDEPSGEEFADWPPPKDDAEKAAYREKCRKYMEHAKKMHSMYGETDETDADDMVTNPDLKPSMAGDKEMPVKMSEVQALIATAVKEALAREAKGSLGELQKFAEETKAAERKRAVDDVIDRLGREGKLAPVERATVKARLLRADARRVVSKFAENGKTVEATEFDLQVRELERRPTRFGEQFKAPEGAGEEAGTEKETVQKFAEMHEKAFALAGTSTKEFVATWEASSPDEKARTLEEARRFLGGR